MKSRLVDVGSLRKSSLQPSARSAWHPEHLKPFPEINRSERLHLRPLREDDILENYLNWFRDQEVTRFLEVSNLERHECIAFLQAGQLSGNYRVYAICVNDTNEHIGNLKLGELQRPHGLSDLVTVVGNRNYWGRGFATEAIKLGVSMAFDQMNIRKLSAGMYTANLRSLGAYMKAGFKIDAVMHEQYFKFGSSQDIIKIGYVNPRFLLATECMQP